jgi:hypothetical protein
LPVAIFGAVATIVRILSATSLWRSNFLDRGPRS